MRAPVLSSAIPQRLRRSLPMISRVLAAIAGGYAVTSLLTLALPLILVSFGIDQAQALLGTTIGSVFFWAAIIMAVFHARSAMWAWLWLVGAALLLALATLFLWPEG